MKSLFIAKDNKKSEILIIAHLIRIINKQLFINYISNFC